MENYVKLEGKLSILIGALGLIIFLSNFIFINARDNYLIFIGIFSLFCIGYGILIKTNHSSEEDKKLFRFKVRFSSYIFLLVGTVILSIYIYENYN